MTRAEAIAYRNKIETAALLLVGGYMTRVSLLSVMRKITYVLFGSPKMIGRRLFRHIISLPNIIKSSLLMAESCPMVIFCGMILFQSLALIQLWPH